MYNINIKKTIFIIGKASKDVVALLKSQGYNTGLFADSSIKKHETVDELVLVDFSSQESILVSIKQYQGSVDGIIVRYENYITAKPLIAKYYKLQTASIEAYKASTDKSLMREAFLQYNPKNSPQYQEVENLSEALQFAKRYQYPVIIKPTNLVKSLLISKSNNDKELEKNYNYAIANIKRLYKKYKVPRTPKLIIEQCLQGTTHSVAAFMDKDGKVHIAKGIVDLVMGQALGIDDNFVYSRTLPTGLSNPQQQEIYNVAKEGMKALNLVNSPGHVELFYTNDGPKIIEIGPRIGGYRTRMYRAHTGDELDVTEVQLSQGVIPTFTDGIKKHITVFELFPEKKGLFQTITNEQELKKLPSLTYYSKKYKAGQECGLTKDGFKAVAIIIIEHKNARQFKQDKKFIEESVRVILKK